MAQNNQLNDKKDGRFELFYRKGWAYLIVYSPNGQGKPVYPEQIENRMKLLRVPKVGSRKLRDIVAEASGDAVQLIEWPDGEYLVSEIEVSVAEDEMSAAVTVHPPKKGAAPPFPEDVQDALSEHGVTRGVDMEAIEKLLLRRDFSKQVQVAQGREPVHGTSGSIEYYFNTNRIKPYLEMDFGRINLKELNFIEEKKEGDLLAELMPPVMAVDGFTVTGRVLSADKDTAKVELLPSENTKLSMDKSSLLAKCDGNVKLDKGKVIIEPVVTVENVNYETGNIHFDGSVVVNGSIADGFEIEADGDIQVGKGVGKARLKAEGNVLLKTGINGNGAGEIICSGDFYSKYIESSRVHCGGNAFLEEAVMHSDLSVRGHCVLNGKRSEIIAGSITVGGSLWCKKLGSIYEAPTRVDVGIIPDRLDVFRKLKKDLEAKRIELDKAEEQIDQLERAVAEGVQDERIPAAMDQMQSVIITLRSETADLQKKFHREREQLHASKESMVVIEDTIFKGVTIGFGSMEYRPPDNGARKTILQAGMDKIVESGFNFHNKPKLDFG